MKKLICMMTLALTLAFAQNTMAEVKLARVDLARVLAQAPQKASAEAKIKSQLSGKESELKRMETEIKAMQEKGQRDAPTMSSSQINDLQREIEKKVSDFQYKKRSFNEDAQRLSGEEQKAIFAQIKAVIEQVARAGNYGAVIRSDTLAYADSQVVDITDQVLAQLGKQ